jgi:hypothetical protein
MLHFLRVMMRMQPKGDVSHDQPDSGSTGLWLPWVVVLSCLAVAAFLWPWRTGPDAVHLLFKSSVMWSGLWPVLIGGGIFVLLSRSLSRWWGPECHGVPAGDILTIYTGLVARVHQSVGSALAVCRPIWQRATRAVHPLQAFFRALPAALVKGEDMLSYWPVGGGLMLAVLLVALALLSWQ